MHERMYPLSEEGKDLWGHETATLRLFRFQFAIIEELALSDSLTMADVVNNAVVSFLKQRVNEDPEFADRVHPIVQEAVDQKMSKLRAEIGEALFERLGIAKPDELPGSDEPGATFDVLGDNL